MDLQKLNPWNWFKHEEDQAGSSLIPVKRSANEGDMPVTSTRTSNPMLAIHQQIDRLFEDAFRGFGLPSLTSRLGDLSQSSDTTEFRPSLNVSGDDNSYQVALEAPGMSKSEIDIDVSGDMLTIRGQKEEEKESKDRHFFRVERSYGAFQRTLSLPEDANPDEIDATLKNGVLTITIPRLETVDSSVKKITINH